MLGKSGDSHCFQSVVDGFFPLHASTEFVFFSRAILHGSLLDFCPNNMITSQVRSTDYRILSFPLSTSRPSVVASVLPIADLDRIGTLYGSVVPIRVGYPRVYIRYLPEVYSL